MRTGMVILSDERSMICYVGVALLLSFSIIYNYKMADSKGNILKVRLGNDTRRQMLYNTNISYNDLVLMLQRIYAGILKASDDITLKYFDEDGDLITVVDDGDFAHAREYSKTGVVNMVVYVNGKDVRTSIDGMGVAKMRQELTQVRDRVNTIIDTLANQTGDLNIGQTTTTNEQITVTEPQTEQADPASTIVPSVEEKVKPVSTEALTIFDPFKSSSSPTLMTVASTVATATTYSSQSPSVNVQPASTDTSTTVPPSTANTSHLFQSQDNSSFLDQSSQQVPAQQTGQIVGGGAPQTGQQLTSSGTSSPNPSQMQQAGYYQGGQGNNTGTPSSYGVGQSYRPPTQYPTAASSQTGQQQGNYSTPSQVSYGNQGYTGGASYPTQSSAPTLPTSSTMPNYPQPHQGTGGPPTAMPGTTPGYPPSSYSQSYGGPPQPGPYASGPPTSQYPVGGASRGPRYGTAYKVGY